MSQRPHISEHFIQDPSPSTSGSSHVPPVYIPGPTSPISKPISKPSMTSKILPNGNIRRIISSSLVTAESNKTPNRERYNRVRVEDLLNSSSSGSKEPQKVLVHHQFETPLAQFLCEYPSCHRKFSTFASRAIHQRRTHAPPTSFICQHCNSSFSTSPNLNKHVSHPHHF